MKTEWQSAKRILCVRLDSVGDVLMTTPAIRAIKDSRPDREVTLLTSPSGAKIASMVPEIDDVMTYEAPWMKATKPRADAQPEYQMAHQLREKAFDAVVIFTVYSQNPLPPAFLCYLADIPLRLAYCHENPYQLLTHWVPDPEPQQTFRHEVQRQLDLVETVGFTTSAQKLSLAVPQKAQIWVDRLLDGWNVQENAWAVLHPGATAASRRYSPERFAEVARQLAGQNNWKLAVTGTAAEKELVDRVCGQSGPAIRNLAGQLTLAELAALIDRAPLLISNNTGPVHMAAALGTPVVDLYALTNVQHGPWQVPSRVLYQEVDCKICYKSVCPEKHHNCLRKVPSRAVVDAARELLAATSSAVNGVVASHGAAVGVSLDQWSHTPAELLTVAGGTEQ